MIVLEHRYDRFPNSISGQSSFNHGSEICISLIGPAFNVADIENVANLSISEMKSGHWHIPSKYDSSLQSSLAPLVG